MKSTAFRMLCRVLIVSLFAMSFQSAMAGMIGTDQAAGPGTTQTERAALVSLLNRSDIGNQLQAHGVDPDAAKARVASMTDQEVRTLSGQIDALPAGASNSGWWIAAVIIIAAVIWYAYK
ncbi:MAG TPA: PA2779 family protein [Burkholderiaceae bacterium]|nr:PA2779 family protein [Burkholderiaceae bacterium]